MWPSLLDVTLELDPAERRELRTKIRAATLAALADLGGEAPRNAILERAAATAGITPRELHARTPDGNRHDRLVDEQLAYVLTNLKHDGLVENPARGVWRLAGAALDAPEPAVEAPVAPDRLAELRAMPYREYLRTGEWRRTRAAALLRAQNACSFDVTHTSRLEVHHRTYERLGEELAGDLLVLCKSCHDLHHKANGRPRKLTPPRQSLLRRILLG